MADTIDPNIKYGGGPHDVQTALASVSRTIGAVEDTEVRLTKLKSRVEQLPEGPGRDSLARSLVESEAEMQRDLNSLYRELQNLMAGETDEHER